jgi:succinyl-diaminopimelate desuccinylase
MRAVIADYFGGAVGIASCGVFGNLTSANGISRVLDDGRLYFTLDIRYGSETNLSIMAPAMTAALDRFGFEMEVHEDDPGFLLDENGREMEIVLNTCRACGNKPEAMPFKMGGGTYARKLRNAFAISHSLPLVDAKPELPAGHGGAHQRDEAISIQGFMEAVFYLTKVVMEVDKLL